MNGALVVTYHPALDVPSGRAGWTVDGGGFSAVLPQCMCSRTPCARERCAKRDHCHRTDGWHREHVESFADRVAKTFRPALAAVWADA